MRRLWIIDGHNVIHRSKVLRELLSSGASDAAQRRLVEQGQMLHDSTQNSVLIIFDSRHAKSLGEKWLERQKRSGFEIVYGSSDEQADTLIERCVVSSPTTQGEIFVVTEDNAIRRTIEAAGAYSVSVEEFGDRLRRIEREKTRMLAQKTRNADTDFRNGIPL